jgi:hypothetical protein
LTEITLSKERDDKGTILFGPSPWFSSWFGHSSWPGMQRQMVPSFEMIDHVRSVYDMVDKARST